ncbi:MAG: phosphoribosyltransferase [Thermoproteales archaeon]|nr:phosphoribosyltransferase [Thermoproteales archaeon]
MEKDKFQVLSWDEFYWDIFDLGKKIKKSYQADILIAVARGGWVVGRIISDLLEIDRVASIGVKFYKGINSRNERPVITQPLSIDVKNQKVLIVDDIADTGETVKIVREYVLKGEPKDVKIAVVYLKPWCQVKVDFFIKETDKWVVFPYERMETINYLLKKMKLKGLEENEVLTAIANLGFDKFTIKKVLKQLEV